MKLSELVYLAVKKAIYYDDNSFTYESFIQHKFDGDPDYATNINNVFSPLNMAISELSDLERIPYIVDKVNIENNAFSLSSLSKKVKEIVAIAYIDQYTGEIVPVPYHKFGNAIRLTRPVNGDVYVEYKQLIPYLGIGNENNYEYIYSPLNNDGTRTLLSSHDVEMEDYGINDHMCTKIMEFIKGELNEGVASDLGNMHVTRAMQFFADIDVVRSELRQTVVQPKYKIGD